MLTAVITDATRSPASLHGRIRDTVGVDELLCAATNPAEAAERRRVERMVYV